jgi:hypothetical protein
MKKNTYNIPEHTFGALRRYVDEGLEPGGFLTAVLENDLFGAFGKADHINIERLYDICMHIYNEEPSHCWGKEGTVSEWCKYVRQRGVE